ncbi:hypothetical protein [Cognatishimia sp. MH4019]|uniref:hypothetical protein n=1 Tax=Cognatishimia sp. MH4019 TaxID=2854030 RepID=UPI001CD1AFDA|nr:hypothetical protein [Cognatishimia sp. MH4019]
MKIYNFDAETGVYTGEAAADKSPRDGAWLVPAFATKIRPPQVPDGRVAIFRDGAWTIVEDHVGTEYWMPDGSHHVIEAYGDVPPEVALFEEPDLRTDAEKRQDVVRDVQAIASAVRTIATEGADHVKIAGWNAKVERATRVIAGAGSDADVRVLGAEAQIRGRSVEEQAQIIVARAEALGELNGLVEGFESELIEKAQAGYVEVVSGFVEQAEKSLEGQSRDTIAVWVIETAQKLKAALA